MLLAQKVLWRSALVFFLLEFNQMEKCSSKKLKICAPPPEKNQLPKKFQILISSPTERKLTYKLTTFKPQPLKKTKHTKFQENKWKSNLIKTELKIEIFLKSQPQNPKRSTHNLHWI